MNLFSTGDIVKLTGFSATTLDRWCADGILKPVAGGVGHGNHRQWSFTQAVGCVIAAELYRSTRSCCVDYLGVVVDAFGAVDEAWLDERIQSRGRYFVQPHFGKPWLQGDDSHGAFPDVAAALQKVQDHAAKKATPKRNRRKATK